MDEYDRLIAIQKINEYFESKNKKVYQEVKLRPRSNVKWNKEKLQQYRKEYYQANKEYWKAYGRAYYFRNKNLKGHHTDL